MNVYGWVLLAAFAIAAAADWFAVWRGRRDIEAMAKPAVLVILIMLAWLLRADTESYGQALLIGLAFSLVGDVALLGRTDGSFLVGLVAFLLGHMAYLAAFRRFPGDQPIWSAMLLVLVAVIWVVVTRLGPRARESWRDGIPLLVYAVLLGAMTVLAWATGVVWVGVGGTLFLVSDSVLAYDRFERALTWARPVVMVTYHLAQLLIVLGLLLA